VRPGGVMGGGRGRRVGSYGGAVGADFATEGVILEIGTGGVVYHGVGATAFIHRGGAGMDIVPDIPHVIRHGDVNFSGALQAE
jgi:hypothetical protein